MNQILKRQTSRFLFGSKFPDVTVTVFITILEQNWYNSCQSSTTFSEVNVKDTFTSHIDKKNIFDIFIDFLIFIHFHYMKMHRLLSYLQRRNILNINWCQLKLIQGCSVLPITHSWSCFNTPLSSPVRSLTENFLYSSLE